MLLKNKEKMLFLGNIRFHKSYNTPKNILFYVPTIKPLWQNIHLLKIVMSFYYFKIPQREWRLPYDVVGKNLSNNYNFLNYKGHL